MFIVNHKTYNILINEYKYVNISTLDCFTKKLNCGVRHQVITTIV